MSKSKIINIRISPELKRGAKNLAEDDGRSLSNWITRLIEREIKKTAKEKKGREESS
jgi:predicted HicB family RNase H-like nuclease